MIHIPSWWLYAAGLAGFIVGLISGWILRNNLPGGDL